MPGELVVKFEARGAVSQLMKCKDDIVVLDGPAGTGKSTGALQKIHIAMHKYPGAKALFVRKTRASLTNTGMATFQDHVIAPGEPVNFHTPSQSYRGYPGDSRVVVGGLDDTTKIMSSDYDIIYVQEGTEASREDVEMLMTRLRNGKMPYQQLILDVNPSFPSHWINQDALSGKITRFWSKHEDNPMLWDKIKKEWTERGKKYIKVLDNLTGVRYKRLRLGLWVAAEGIVFEDFNPNVHIIDRFKIPEDWKTMWVFDFGFTHPFFWGEFAIDHDKNLYLVHQIYMTGRIVEDHCKKINALKLRQPNYVICDHDAEDRATLERHLAIKTQPAKKEVTPGIQALASRLRIGPNGKPRILFMRDSLLEVDKELKGKMLPTKVEEEFESYEWEKSSKGVMLKEIPRKEYDHGIDGTRYGCMHIDGGSARNNRPKIAALN